MWLCGAEIPSSETDVKCDFGFWKFEMVVDGKQEVGCPKGIYFKMHIHYQHSWSFAQFLICKDEWLSSYSGLLLKQ